MQLGMQDQAFLGPESGMAIPTDDGGVELLISTQWLHVDHEQVAACLGLPPDKVRLTLAGVSLGAPTSRRQRGACAQPLGQPRIVPPPIHTPQPLWWRKGLRADCRVWLTGRW